MKALLSPLRVFLLVVLFIILISRLKLLLVRQFDPDEFAYLHWAWLTLQGKLPYRDFFFYTTPLFLWPLTVLFLLPQGPAIALGGRLMMFSVYGILLLLAFIVTKRLTRNSDASLFAVILLAAFPMTLDKTIEIRPDALMCVLVASSFLVAVKRKFFFSGILGGTGVVLFLKAAVLLPALLPLLVFEKKETGKRVLFFAGGALVPVLLFLLYVVSQGIAASFWDAIVNAGRAVNNQQGGFSPFAGLSPFPLVYLAKGGVSLPWTVNTAILLLSVPGLLALWQMTKKTPSFFVSALIFFLASGALFLFFPRPHMQYFIPLSVVASILTAISFTAFLRKTADRIRLPAFFPAGLAAFSLVLLTSVLMQTADRLNTGSSNEEQMQVLSDVPKLIRPEESVYDMVGSYIFRPDGFYICCHPYAQFIDQLKFTLPQLRDSLVASRTKFLVMDQKGYVFWIAKPEDLAFLTTHYLPTPYKKIYTLGSRFQCASGSCIQLDAHGRRIPNQPTQTFDVVIGEQYRITVQPENQTVIISGKLYKNGDTVQFFPTLYSFTVSPEVTSFSIQMNR